MLTNFFGKSKPITLLITLVIFLCLLLATFLNAKINVNYFETTFLFILMLALIVFINKKNNLSFDNSYVSLIFVLLIGVFPNVIKINTVFFTNLTLLFFLRKVYSLQSNNKSINKLFDAGLWLGISFLIEPFSLLFTITLYASIYTHQHFSFQKLMTPIIGFITPPFLFFTYCLLYDKTEVFFNFFDWYTYYDLTIYNNLIYYIPIYVISIFIFISVIIKTPKALAIKNKFRKSWLLILLNFLCALALLAVVKNRDGSEFLYLLFPSSVIIANAIEIYEHKWAGNIFIIILTLFSFTMSLIQ